MNPMRRSEFQYRNFVKIRTFFSHTLSAISVDFFAFLHFESVDLLENILSTLKVILLNRLKLLKFIKNNSTCK